MTLYEFWLAIVKRWKLIIIVPVVCVLACLTLFVVHNSVAGATYTAISRIVVNSQVQGVAGFAASEGRQYLVELYGDETPDNMMTITAKGNADTMTVTITVVGLDETECVSAANAVAEAAERDAEETFSAIEELPYSGMVEEATMTTAEETGGGVLKYVAAAILAGLFLAVCIVVVLDVRKRSIKTAEAAQEAVELPVLEIIPAANGERLLANVRFASKKENLNSAYVVPAGDVEAARATCELLAKASEGDDAQEPSIECGTPLGESMQSAYEARKSDAVVVTARQWADTLPQLESTVAELRLADANLVGLVFVKDKLK